MSIMARLREGTWPQHQHAESRPLEQELAAGKLPREQYVAMLAQRLLIHRHLEHALRALRASDLRVADVVREELMQEENLRRDLAHFGVDADAVQPAAATKRLVGEVDRLVSEHPIALLGVYYVFEGSKNGARMVARALRGAYGLADGPGLLYMDPHGEQQRPLWADFKAKTDAVDLDETEQDAIVRAAQLTFTLVSDLDEELHDRRLTAKGAR